MLHHIEPNSCTRELMKLLDFQFKLLEFACTTNLRPPFSRVDQPEFEKTFGVSTGWLCDKLWPSRGITQTKFYEKLEALISYVQSHPAEGAVVSSSFRASSAIMFGIIADDNQVKDDERTEFIGKGPDLVSFGAELAKETFQQVG